MGLLEGTVLIFATASVGVITSCDENFSDYDGNNRRLGDSIEGWESVWTASSPIS